MRKVVSEGLVRALLKECSLESSSRTFERDIKMKTAPRPTSFGSLEQRVANQERRINKGVQRGTLTQDEASGLRDRLNTAQQTIQNDAFDGNGSSRLADQRKMLNGIGADIHAQKRNGDIDPGQRMNNIDQRIQKGLADGSLTQQEADGLTASATDLRSKLDAASTPEEKAALTGQLNDLSKQVHAGRHNDEMDADKRVQSFSARIQAGVANGSLNQAEAARLTSRVDSLSQNGGADAQTVNQLNRDIFVQKHDRQMDAGVAQSAIGARLDSLESSGKLSPDQVSQFRTEL